MKKILVLGAGMVGKAIIADLCKGYRVTAVDVSGSSLSKISEKFPIKTVKANIENDESISGLINDCDLVISAVPGFMGYDTLKKIIETGKNVVDISFMPENFLDLNDLAAENGVIAITDCGVAPGIPNLIAGYYNEIMKIESFEYVVGGLPKAKTYPFYYKAPFSPVDVIEEYTRPARYKENGKILTKPAMSEVEMMDFDKVGTLEAFFTDGLRSLLTTMKNIPSMKEKTLRHPGHISLVKALAKAGFFDKNPLTINNTAIRPIDFTSKILINNWKLGPEEHEFTVMRIVINGYKDNKKTEIIYELYDEFDAVTGLSSMARTTGFVATACADMILKNKYSNKGVSPLELVGKNQDCYNFIINYQKERDINYSLTEKELKD